MKFSLSWLCDHLTLKANVSLDALATKLVELGLEVDAIEDPAARYNGFVVAKVLEANPHPNADRLRVCTVSLGGAKGTEPPLQVVCGGAQCARKSKNCLCASGSPHSCHRSIPEKRRHSRRGERGHDLLGGRTLLARRSSDKPSRRYFRASARRRSWPTARGLFGVDGPPLGCVGDAESG